MDLSVAQDDMDVAPAGELGKLAAFVARGDFCAPVTLDWAVLPATGAIASDVNTIYWARIAQACDAGWEIVSTPKLGGPSTILTAGQPAPPQAFAVDSQALYVLTNDAQNRSEILSLPKSGGAATVVVPPDPCRSITAFAIDASTIYWISMTPGSPVVGQILAIPRSGGASTVIASSLKLTGGPLIVDGGDLLVAANDGLVRIPKLGGTAIPLLGRFRGRVIFTIDDKDIFFAFAGGVARLSKKGGDFITVAQTELDTVPRGIAVDDRHLFWSYIGQFTPLRQYDSKHRASLWAAAKDGSNPVRLRRSAPTEFAVDFSALYFAEGSAGLIRQGTDCAFGVTRSTVISSPCAPELVDSIEAQQLFSDGTSLFSLNRHNLIRTTTSGAARTVLATSTEFSSMAVDDVNVYLADKGAIKRVSKAGGPTQLLVNSPSQMPLQLDGAYVYYQDPNGGTWRVAKSGSTSSLVPLGTGQFFVGVDDQSWYALTFGSGSVDRLWSVPQTGGVAKLLASIDPQPIELVALDASRLYFRQGTVWGTWPVGVSKSGGLVAYPTLTSWKDYYIAAVAQDADSLLVAIEHRPDCPCEGTFSLVMTKKDGSGQPSTVVYGVSIGALAMDDQHVFWSDWGNSGVYRQSRTCGPTCSSSYPPGPPPAPPTACPTLTGDSGLSIDGGGNGGDGGMPALAAAGCAPVTLASGPAVGSNLGQDSTALYTLAGPPNAVTPFTIQRIAKSGGPSLPVAQLRSEFVVDDSGMYWVDWTSQGSPLIRQRVGGLPAQIVNTAFAQQPLITDGQNVYWVEPGSPSRLMFVPESGGSGTMLSSYDASVMTLAADGRNAYWSDVFGILRSVPTTGGAPRILADWRPPPHFITSLASDGTRVTFGDVADGLHAVPVQGGPSTTLYGVRPGFTRERATLPKVVGNTIYWLSESGSGEYVERRLLSIRSDGSAATVLANVSSVSGLVADSAALYYVEIIESQPTLQKVPFSCGLEPDGGVADLGAATDLK